MRRREININEVVVFGGRYTAEKILSGPQNAAQNLFINYCKEHKGIFIQYFFDGREHSLWQKLFGYKINQTENGIILTLGIFRIIPCLRNFKPAVIHLTTFERYGILFFLYKVFFKVKIIYNSHGIILFENNYLKLAKGFTAFKDRVCENIYLKYSDVVIFPSEQAIEIAKRYYKIGADKIKVIPGGVESVFFNSGKKKGTNSILKAVMMYKNSLNRSGFELILNILSGKVENIEIYLITSEEIKLQKSIIEQINIISPMETIELAEFYKDKDIFLSLNEYDTFSISTAEAMAGGLIPVVTEETGISSMLTEDVNGYVFSYSKPDKLTEILTKLIKSDSNKLSKLSRNAILAAQNLNWQNIYSLYKNLY